MPSKSLRGKPRSGAKAKIQVAPKKPLPAPKRAAAARPTVNVNIATRARLETVMSKADAKRLADHRKNVGGWKTPPTVQSSRAKLTVTGAHSK